MHVTRHGLHHAKEVLHAKVSDLVHKIHAARFHVTRDGLYLANEDLHAW